MKADKKDTLPFLHGIPVSVKEQFEMKGLLSTVGCAMLNQRATEDSECVVPWLEAGVIPLVRGNLPQGALSIHSTNLIWGTARNFWDNDRSCGGSSGGDGGGSREMNQVGRLCASLLFGKEGEV